MALKFRLIEDAAVPLSEGGSFDRYRIERLLGRGGMGEVYVAYDTRLRRRVALKILRVEEVERSESFQQARARLLREARAGAGIHDPHVVSVFDIGEHDSTPYIAMELVDGTPLRRFVGDPGVSLGERLRWLQQIARGLGSLHRAGIVHRDVKPDNIMIDRGRSAKILDFGIAKHTPPPYGISEEPASSASAPLTLAGHVAGTPSYMAPEQRMGWPVDGRADLFALGVVAWELLAGRHPRQLGWTASGAAPAPKLAEAVPGFPRELSNVVARALEVEPAARYASMDDFVQALDGSASEDLRLPGPPADPTERAVPHPAAREAPTISSPGNVPLGSSEITNVKVGDLAAAPTAPIGPSAPTPDERVAPSREAWTGGIEPTRRALTTARAPSRAASGLLFGAAALLLAGGGLVLAALWMAGVFNRNPVPATATTSAPLVSTPSAGGGSSAAPPPSSAGAEPSATLARPPATSKPLPAATTHGQRRVPFPCTEHCGPRQDCVNGMCVCRTDAQTKNCSGICADIDRDPLNCGSCGHRCGAKEFCWFGSCSTCADRGLTACAHECANLGSDINNCGACGRRCTEGKVCKSGACELP